MILVPIYTRYYTRKLQNIENSGKCETDSRSQQDGARVKMNGCLLMLRMNGCLLMLMNHVCD